MLNGSMIIERLEDEGRSAVKFPDGTMICHHRYEVTTGNWSAWGGVYAAPVTPKPQNFLVPFISPPTTMYYVETDGLNVWCATRNEESPSTTNTTPSSFQVIRGASGSNNIKLIANIIAIGRWK